MVAIFFLLINASMRPLKVMGLPGLGAGEEFDPWDGSWYIRGQGETWDTEPISPAEASGSESFRNDRKN